MNGGSALWPRVLTVGDALADIQYWVERMPGPGEDARILAMEENTGGSAANSAMGLAWLGLSCGFCGCVGKDPGGERVLHMLSQAGVDTRLVQRAGRTGYVLSMIDPTGERTMFSYRGASACLNPVPGIQEALARAKVLLLSGYLLADEGQAPFALEWMRQARGAGTRVALDASPKLGGLPEEVRETALSLCDIFLPNRDELATAGAGSWRENLEHLADTIPCIAVKLGGKGALLRVKPGFLPSHNPALDLEEAPSCKVEPLDTTGAGDAFNAGFLAAFLRGLPPRQWLETGNWLAGKVISTKGATRLYEMEPPFSWPASNSPGRPNGER